MALIKPGSVKCYLLHRSPSLHYTDTCLRHSGQSSAPKYTGHKRAKARDSSWTFDNVSICCACHSGWGWGRERGNTAIRLTGANHTASGAQKWKEHSPTEDRQECLTFRKMGHKLSQAPVMTKNPYCIFAHNASIKFFLACNVNEWKVWNGSVYRTRNCRYALTLVITTDRWPGALPNAWSRFEAFEPLSTTVLDYLIPSHNCFNHLLISFKVQHCVIHLFYSDIHSTLFTVIAIVTCCTPIDQKMKENMLWCPLLKASIYIL